jgi:hypothetical protein
MTPGHGDPHESCRPVDRFEDLWLLKRATSAFRFEARSEWLELFEPDFVGDLITTPGPVYRGREARQRDPGSCWSALTPITDTNLNSRCWGPTPPAVSGPCRTGSIGPRRQHCRCHGHTILSLVTTMNVPETNGHWRFRRSSDPHALGVTS